MPFPRRSEGRNLLRLRKSSKFERSKLRRVGAKIFGQD
jgi:hypothetical protein